MSKFEPKKSSSSYRRSSKASDSEDRPSQLLQASDVLQGLLQNGKSPLADQFQRWRIWRSWPEIVGKTISENSYPVSYDRGLMCVFVKNSAWLQELSFLSGSICKKINDHLGYQWVQQIRFTLDRRQVPSPHESEFNPDLSSKE